MTQRFLKMTLVLAALVFALPSLAQQKTILFDAMHAQTAGNADWTLDEDSCGTAQRFPTPDQAGITSSTPETFWSGGHSAMGVDLVKKGFHVESLPIGSRVTYNDGTNAQDLSHYNIYVLPEPNIRLTSTEITAIRNFVNAGGGLLLISDHAGADRNNDGWDPPTILNELVGTVMGITFNANSADTTAGWFDNSPDDNYTTDTSSPIIFTGPYGSPSAGRGLGLFGSTSMTVSGTGKAHIWKSGAAHGTTLVTYATSTYGAGRVAAVGDSSITEDATNGCGHTTYLGYNDPAWDNGKLIANGIAYVGGTGGGGGGDTTPPTVSITSPANGATVSGTISVNATASDNVGVTKVEFYLDGTLKSTDTTSPYSWSFDTTTVSNGSHSLTAKAYDAALNSTTSTAVSVTVNNVATGTDISGWTVTQANATVVYTIPAGTIVPANGYLVIGRDATKAAFQTFWGVTLASNVVYLTTAGAFPQINGSENYTLKNASGTVIDGPTISQSSSAGQSIQRKDPCQAAGLTASWNVLTSTSGTPGSGAGAGCAHGMVINEFSDATGTNNFVYEFIELHNDK
ncbi:MAG: hypothetical protein JWN02_1657 [Acidobacteria bacterium]|nr:hypothetical protein [Acidobacteriota bacterium]